MYGGKILNIYIYIYKKIVIFIVYVVRWIWNRILKEIYFINDNDIVLIFSVLIYKRSIMDI